jgi:hypothetical protein
MNHLLLCSFVSIFVGISVAQAEILRFKASLAGDRCSWSEGQSTFPCKHFQSSVEDAEIELVYEAEYDLWWGKWTTKLDVGGVVYAADVQVFRPGANPSDNYRSEIALINSESGATSSVAIAAQPGWRELTLQTTPFWQTENGKQVEYKGTLNLYPPTAE